MLKTSGRSAARRADSTATIHERGELRAEWIDNVSFVDAVLGRIVEAVVLRVAVSKPCERLDRHICYDHPSRLVVDGMIGNQVFYQRCLTNLINLAYLKYELLNDLTLL